MGQTSIGSASPQDNNENHGSDGLPSKTLGAETGPMQQNLALPETGLDKQAQSVQRGDSVPTPGYSPRDIDEARNAKEEDGTKG